MALLDIIEESENMPPQLFTASPAPGEDLVLDRAAGTVAWIGVTDPNDVDEVEFIWEITDIGLQGTAQPWVQGRVRGSALLLEPAADLQGELLRVRAVDGFGAQLVVEWRLFVPGEGT
jgi:hypothetical protein